MTILQTFWIVLIIETGIEKNKKIIKKKKLKRHYKKRKLISNFYTGCQIPINQTSDMKSIDMNIINVFLS